MSSLLNDEALRVRLANANRAKAVTTFDETVMFSNTYHQLFLRPCRAIVAFNEVLRLRQRRRL